MNDGLNPETWRIAMEEMREILIEVARSRQLMTYGELAAKMQTIRANPGSYVFHRLMRDMCAEELERSQTMLCALVVRKDTRQPGHGYFADLLGNQQDLEAAWREDLERLYTYWSAYDG